ncbi:unnamed protein product [Tuber melanosporum]|uniref:(Perigord truffle) hypothetical protein n=1 Tax=Tuber melanosporum (strain Mel28) TaxID=656061 RepID=D5GDU3_TUBMM|nr:uncharacterized protein GSTUM_00006276001 [Tuber melanosporum]CAZ82686.1 unnamed protein product [Tuber melanosporum]
MRLCDAGLVRPGCWEDGFGADASIEYLPACACGAFARAFEHSCIDPVAREVREGGGDFEDIVVGAWS